MIKFIPIVLALVIASPATAGTLDMFVLDATQRTTAMGLDDPSCCEIDPRAVDHLLPGVLINLSAVATGVAAGVPVDLTGKFLAPKRIVDDPQYQDCCAALITFLNTLPHGIVDTDSVFAPPP